MAGMQWLHSIDIALTIPFHFACVIFISSVKMTLDRTAISSKAFYKSMCCYCQTLSHDSKTEEIKQVHVDLEI